MSTSEVNRNDPGPKITLSLLEAALDHLEEGVIVTDNGTETSGPTISYANRAFTRMTGYASGELIGQSPRLLHGPKTDTEVIARLKEYYEAGDSTRGESVNYRKDGSEFVMNWQVHPVRGKQGIITHYIGVHKDVSRIRRLEGNLLQAQKIDAVARLASGIAHDFNNVLAVILSFSELIQENTEGQESLNSFANQIHKAARRAAELTSELMAFSRRERVEPELLDLSDILGQMTRIIRRILPENIEVKASETSDPIYVRINRAALEQALVHLTTNSRDALPTGGRIDIRLTSLAPEDCEDVLPEISSPRSFAVITFTDNGEGIAQETIMRVFEPFFTTKAIGKGTGLGLSTAYATIKNAGGHIKIESDPGQGTQVTLYLPRESVDGGSPQPVPPPVERVAIDQVPVLVVEDDESMRDCIAGVLSIYNYEVFSAASAEEALEEHGNRADTIKVLLTDLVLPKMNGSDLARIFLEKNPEIRVLYMTGYDEESHGLGDLPGKAALLTKPFSLNQVLQSVQETLGS